MTFDGTHTPGEILAQQVGLLGQVSDAVAASVANLRDVSGDDLLSAISKLEKVRRVIVAADAKIHATIADRDRKRGRSTGSTAQETADQLGLTPGEAHERINRGKRSESQGGSAHSEGTISDAQEEAIARIMRKVPSRVSEEDQARLERELVGLARKGKSPRALTSYSMRRIRDLDPEYGRHAQERQQERRSLNRGSIDSDGVSSIGIVAEPRLLALIDAMLARFGRPGRCIAAPVDPLTGEAVDITDLAANDTRTPGQRAYDALCHVLALRLSEAVPSPRGVASIVVRMTPEELDDPDAMVQADAGTDLSVRQAVTLAGGAPWFVQLVREGRPELHKIDVDSGAGRIATRIQRLWLYAAHGGCSFPGCDMPAARCEFEHVEDYARCGETTVSKGSLDCPLHHRRKGTLPHQWRKLVDRDDPGKPRWIPPTRSRFAA